MWKIFSWLHTSKNKIIKRSLTEDEELIIENQYKEIVDYAKKTSAEKYTTNKKKTHEYNNTCPNCGNNNEKEIVNRFAQVKGKGEVSGSVSGNLFGVYGSVYGHSEIDTLTVNHCNKCGNQWEKTEAKYVSAENIISDKLQRIGWYIKDNDDNSFWVMDYKSFKDYYLETILKLVELVWDDDEYYTPRFSKDILKNYFKSIMEEDNIVI